MIYACARESLSLKGPWIIENRLGRFESKPGKFATAKADGKGSRGAIFVGPFVSPRPSRLLE